jgi:hypothetical protein
MAGKSPIKLSSRAVLLGRILTNHIKHNGNIKISGLTLGVVESIVDQLKFWRKSGIMYEVVGGVLCQI